MKPIEIKNIFEKSDIIIRFFTTNLCKDYFLLIRNKNRFIFNYEQIISIKENENDFSMKTTRGEFGFNKPNEIIRF